MSQSRCIPKAKRRQQPAKSHRGGVVATEMAVCLPVLFLIFLGSIDLIRYNLLRNVVTHATYEAARTGVVKGATIADIEAKVQEELFKYTGQMDYTLVTDPATLPASNAKTLKITLTCNIRDAGWILSKHIAGDTMVESAIIGMD